jgi:hypothetical protein
MAYDGKKDGLIDRASPGACRGAQTVVALTPANPGQQIVQNRISAQLEAALEARRERILISRSQVSSLKFRGRLLVGSWSRCAAASATLVMPNSDVVAPSSSNAGQSPSASVAPGPLVFIPPSTVA